MNVKELFIQLYKAPIIFRKDKGNIKSILNVHLEFSLDEIPLKFRNLNYEYLKYEEEFYLNYKNYLKYDKSFELSNDLKKITIWNHLSQKGKIYSNYGYYFYENLNRIINELKNDINTTRAIIYYGNNENANNVLIHKESDDFICLISQSFHIMNNQLFMIQNMRSNDMIYGFLYDTIWAKHCYLEVFKHFNLNEGKIYYNILNAHIYERHFNLLEKIIKGVSL